MTKVLNISGRGSLTLPKELRQRTGIKTGGRVFAEVTSRGILLRAEASFPVEIYNKKRLTEFSRNNEAALAGHRFDK